jgi:hypothetical protein
MCASIPATAQLQTRADRLYVENKGQIGDQHGKPNRGVRYLIARPGLNIQLTSNGFSYDSYVAKRIASAAEKATKPLNHRLHLDDSVVYSYHRVDIELVGANPTPRIESYEQSSDYLNFYTHITEQVNGDQGVTYVRGCGRVIYREVWPGIDLEWLIDSQGNPEYQFMVRPGGDVRRIQLRYHGAQATELAQDAMMMQVSHGWIKERIPASFLATSKRRVDVRYRQLGLNTYGFDVSSLDMALASVETLIIDPIPERLWATYYGGTDNDKCEDVAVAPYGAVFVSGRTQSTDAIATNGSHQTAFDQPADAFILRLSSNGQREWATYYGGTGTDNGLGIALTSNDRVAVAGIAGSNNGIASTGAHQVDKGNGYDAMVVLFDTSGVRQWGTFYGGNGTDYGWGVATLSNNDIVLVGETASNNAISTAGSHQEAQGAAGYDDGFIVKFNANGVRQWGTFLGGNRGDQLLAVATSNDDKILVCGKTGSTTGIGTAGTHKADRATFDTDGFVTCFNAAGTRQWGSYFGGEETEEAHDVAVASDGGVFLVGETNSPADISTAGSQKADYGGAIDGFLARFDQTGNRTWSTYFGDAQEDRANGVATLAGGIVVVTGSTTSTNGVASTTTYQANIGGAEDAFIAKYSDAGQLQWSSYYGGLDSDRGLAVSGASSESVVIVGETSSTQSIATTNVHQPALASDKFDGFIVKIGSNPCVKPTVTMVYEASKCNGEQSEFALTIPSGTLVRWSAPKLGVITSGTLASSSIQVSWNVAGIDTLRVRVIRADDTTCYRDTAFTVTVHVTPSTLVTGLASVCEYSTHQYSVPATKNATYQWWVSQRGKIQGSSTRDSVIIRWDSAGIGADTLRVRVSMNVGGCARDGASIVVVQKLPQPQILGPIAVCEHSTSVYRASNANGRKHRWRVSPRGTVLGSFAQDSVVVQWGGASGGSEADTVEVMETVVATGCSSTALIAVNVRSQPMPVITGSVMPCENSRVLYRVSASEGRVYKWRTSRRGKVVGSQEHDSVEVVWGKAGASLDTVFVREEIVATGCSKDTLMIVKVRVLPNPIISGSPIACAQSQTIYRVVPVSERSYRWSVTSGGRIQGPVNRDSVVVFWDSVRVADDTLTVVETDVINGCLRDASRLIRVGNLPDVSMTGPESVCSEEVSTYQALCGQDASCVWILPAWAQLVGGTLTSSTIRIRWREVGKQTIGIRATVSSTGCTRDTAMIVDVGASPDVSMTGPSSLCLTDSKAKVYSVPAGEPGTVYTWTITPPAFGTITVGGASPEVTIDWQQRGSGTLRVSARSPNGCSRDSLITVTIQDSLSPSISSATGLSACEGDTITLDAGSGYQSYAWYQGATVVGSSRYYQTTQASTYVVRVSNGGCAGSSAAVTTTINSVPTAVVSENPAGTLMVTTDVSQAQYQWYDAASTPWTPLAGATQATYVPSTSGSYGVEVTNVSTGCRRRSAPVQITIGPSPSDPVITSLTPSATVCSGQPVTLRVRTVGGREPYVYQWSDGTALLASSDAVATLTPTSASVSTVTVSCIVTDADGKRDTATMTVTVAPVPDAGITEAPTGTLNAEPAGAGQYQWLGADKTSLSGAISSTYQPSASGTYYVVVTDQGCRDTSEAFVYTAAPPSTGLLVRDYDFGTLPIDAAVNASGGHVGSVIVENRTGQYLELSGASTTGGAAFYVPEQWPRRINDGDTAEIAVRFIPQQQQAYVAQLNVTTNATYTGSSTIQGSGRDKRPREQPIQIALLPTREDVAPGDTIGVMVVVRSMAAPINQALRYRYRLQWDCRVLEPIVLPGVSYDTTGTYAIAAIIDGQYQPGQMLLEQLRFRAKQAEVDTTSIRFIGAGGFTWLDNQDLITAAADTVVRVRLCRDGGPQLIGRTIPSRIVRAAPMPASDVLDIELDIQSPGTLELVATDGRRIITHDVVRTMSHLRLDVSSLSAGVYTLALTTPTGTHYLPVLILP